jgi:hypothetical protein
MSAGSEGLRKGGPGQAIAGHFCLRTPIQKWRQLPWCGSLATI